MERDPGVALDGTIPRAGGADVKDRTETGLFQEVELKEGFI